MTVHRHGFKAEQKNGVRRPELRRRCALVHHGLDPQGSAEYKHVKRDVPLTNAGSLGLCKQQKKMTDQIS
jgi:hypothetical protein